MKLSLAILFFFYAMTSLADSFTVIRDGREYLCRPNGNGSQPPPYNPPPPPNAGELMKCIEKAYAGPFTKSEAQQLCDGAQSDKPADCALKAYGGPFSKAESIRLCQRGTIENADCALKAYAGPYSKEEAITLCKGAAQLMLKALDLLGSSAGIQ